MDEKKYWFRAKRYGYGWYPCSWQGWLVMLGWFIVVALIFYNSYSQQLTDDEVLVTFVPQIITSTTILIFIAWKTGEPARWRWGK